MRRRATAAALRGFDIGSGVNKDDQLGSKVHVFPPLDLPRAGAKTFEDTFDQGDTRRGAWKVRGRVALG